MDHTKKVSRTNDGESQLREGYKPSKPIGLNRPKAVVVPAAPQQNGSQSTKK
jgi:hypothetical protein